MTKPQIIQRLAQAQGLEAELLRMALEAVTVVPTKEPIFVSR